MDETDVPKDFCGRVRLLPLPSVVLFPHAFQQLHVSEPRYLALLKATLDDDGMIAVSLLRPGWEADYDGSPPVYPVVCLARVASHVPSEAGCYNLMLRGVCRATLIREFQVETAYRQVEVAVLEDLYAETGAGRRTRFRRQLMQQCRRLLRDNETALQQFEQFESQSLPLGVLVDILASSLKLGVEVKQNLLAAWSVEKRAEMLLLQLQSLAERPGDCRIPFPPDFSPN